MAHLVVDRLSVRLGEPPRTILENISLDLPPGTIILILGANGSGKSVLLRSILGLLRSEEGAVYLDRKRLTGNFAALHRRAGVCFQNPDIQLFGETVGEDLAIAVADGMGVDEDLVERFDLSGVLDAPPWELSGGVRRRVALAGAFAARPDILFLDEPLLELDYPSIRTLLAELERHCRDGGSVLLASHDTRDIWDMCHRVMILREGAVEFTGSPHDASTFVTPAVGLRPLEVHAG
ncbi:MAG: energy-coupling factor ABC transporter ATP-binding protein [Spirochaetales bacterium]|nr:energy-coupling factor ABC transporter ATP-binding protein [Spirochaetales bacterium]